MANTQAVFGLACPRSNGNHCIATAATSSGNSEVLIPANNGVPGKAISAHMSTLSGIGCATQTSCWATGTSAGGEAAVVHLVSSRPTTFTFKGQPAALFSGALGTGVFCAPDNSCVTPGEEPNGVPLLIIFSRGKITRTTPLPMARFGAGSFGLACTTIESCVAFGVALDGVREVVTPVRQGRLGAPHHLTTQPLAVGCRSANLCFGFGWDSALPTSSDDVAIQIKNGRPGTPRRVPRNIRALDAWCESSRCVILGSIFHTHPRGQVGALYTLW